MMFDKIYVLAKGGVCVYSGLPQDLKTHLSECDIICNEFQVPIEVLLKVSSQGINDKNVKQLCLKTSQSEQQLKSFTNKNETLLHSKGIKIKTKRFNLFDFWYLFCRSMTYTYICQWKSLTSHLLFCTIFCLCLTKSYNPDIGKVDGCFEQNIDLNITCKEREDQKSILEQNLYFNFIGFYVMMLIQVTISTSTFTTELKSFSSEHQNSKILFKQFSLDKFIGKHVHRISSRLVR